MVSIQNSDLPINTKPNTMKSSADIIESVAQNAEKLSDVLEREYRALMDRDVLLINSLGSEKTTLLDSLARLEPHLRAVFTAAEMQQGEHSVNNCCNCAASKMHVIGLWY